MFFREIEFVSRMEKRVDKVRISKEFSKILRHQASEISSVDIRPDGYVKLSTLLDLPFFTRNRIDEAFVRCMVETDSKTRFSLHDEHGLVFIRANQGHSASVAALIDTEQLLHLIESPSDIPKVVHGTDFPAWDRHIKAEGLRRMKRSHIHFAPGILGDEGVRSGMRSSAYIHVYIDASRAMADGIKFYRSSNNVILSDGIEGVIAPKYFAKVIDARNGKVLLDNTTGGPY